METVKNQKRAYIAKVVEDGVDVLFLRWMGLGHANHQLLIKEICDYMEKQYAPVYSEKACCTYVYEKALGELFIEIDKDDKSHVDLIKNVLSDFKWFIDKYEFDLVFDSQAQKYIQYYQSVNVVPQLSPTKGYNTNIAYEAVNSRGLLSPHVITDIREELDLQMHFLEGHDSVSKSVRVGKQEALWNNPSSTTVFFNEDDSHFVLSFEGLTQTEVVFILENSDLMGMNYVLSVVENRTVVKFEKDLSYIVAFYSIATTHQLKLVIPDGDIKDQFEAIIKEELYECRELSEREVENTEFVESIEKIKQQGFGK
jgi:hypothetical protein